MKHLGIDIGTTSICSALLSSDCGLTESITAPNRSFIQSESPWERLQDAELIVSEAINMIDSLISKYPDIVSIGVTGQMHGILYLNSEGKAVSPLYTWQDARGELPYCGESYLSHANRMSGYRMASGYGLVTHFYNAINRLVPAESVSLCTIADYLVMRLSGQVAPLLHASNGASIGCFDLKKLETDHTATEKLSIFTSFLPFVTCTNPLAGSYRGIPISIAIGDNQASFIGSGADEDSILVNVGTGSQISLVSDYVEASGSIELRPFTDDRYLLVGSSLSGGRAYALLEKFFRSVVEMAGCSVESMYPTMTRALEQYECEGCLRVSTLFDGSRDDPTARGSIEGIGLDNFTPEQLILGFMDGIADELYSMYLKMGAPKRSKLIGAGNALRKNPALVRAFERRFGLPLTLSPCQEEAACGAAIFGREALKNRA